MSSEVLACFIVLILKHFYVECMLQTEEQTVRKSVYLDEVGLYHSVNHGIFTVSVFLASFQVSLLDCFIAGFADFMIHYHIDYIKAQANACLKCSSQTRSGLLIRSRYYFYLLVGDQCLHFLTYVALISWAFA